MLTVVTGAPCSGKTTHVLKHATPGDIIIDFDILAQALGSPDPHDHHPEIRIVAVDMRRTAITSAIQAHLRGHTVWIVDTTPDQRMDAYTRAGAQFVNLAVDRAELHRRAEADRPARWHGLIDQHLVKATTARARRGRRGASGTC